MGDIAGWLDRLGLKRYAKTFIANDIDLDLLPELTESDLLALGLSLGHRKKLMRAIRLELAPAARVLQQPTGAERRQVTVLFCDLVGSSGLAERLDPEELQRVMLAYRSCCGEVIDHFGGYIARYLGDGLLVYFGYPQAHEDDAQRAIRAGLTINSRLNAIGPASPEDQPIRLLARIGIHTGLVVIGDIGTGDPREHMDIIGSAPNIAARLQAIAGPGEVVIGQSTHRLVEGLFICDDLGDRHLRGMSVPIAAYRVLRPSNAQSRFEAAARRGLADLVGRDSELQILIECWQQTKAGAGRIVLLEGEAGIGKSRIVQALRDRIAEEQPLTLRYFCSPFYVDTALYPIRDHMERAAGFRKTDGTAIKLDKLEAALTRMTGDGQAAVGLIAPLLGLPFAESGPGPKWTPQQRKARTLDLLADIVFGLASRQPLLMIYEDAHWMDPTSVELVGKVASRLGELPIMMIAVQRPGGPTLVKPGRSDVVSLFLTGLNFEDAAAIVARTAGKSLPPPIVDMIVTRTDGVPLFIEELTKTVLESGLMGDGDGATACDPALLPHAIPESLQDSLMARLDKLAPVKEVAQLAAVLGRSFSYELLAAVCPLDEASLQTALCQLADAELVFRHDRDGDIGYQFKHALLQDAAYASLLHSRRHQLHRKIAVVMERHFPQLVENQPEMIAHHYQRANLPARAIPHLLRAGDAAAARYSATEARAHFAAALALARDLPHDDDAALLCIKATLKLPSVAQGGDHFERDLADLQAARLLAEEQKETRLLSRIHYWIGRIHYVSGRFDLALDSASRALDLATQGGGDDVTADPVNLLARIRCLRGEPKPAILHARRNVAQMQKLGNRIEEAAISGVLAFAHGQHGDFAEAFAAADHGIEVASLVEHLPTLAACIFFRGLVAGWSGDIKTAMPCFAEAIELCEKSGDHFRTYLTMGWRGEACLLAGRISEACVDLRRCLAEGERIGTRFHRSAFQSFLAAATCAEGDWQAAERLSHEALQRAEDEQGWSHAIAQRIAADIVLATGQGPLHQAEHMARAAITIQERRHCRVDLVYSRLTLARILQARGAKAEGAILIEDALAVARKMGLRTALIEQWQGDAVAAAGRIAPWAAEQSD